MSEGVLSSEPVSAEERERLIAFFREFHMDFYFLLYSAKMEKWERANGEVWYTFRWSNIFDFTRFLDRVILKMREDREFRKLFIMVGIVNPDLYYSVYARIPKRMIGRQKDDC